MRRLVRERCDFLAQLATRPAQPTLNVAIAAAVALYELTRSRATEDGRVGTGWRLCKYGWDYQQAPIKEKARQTAAPGSAVIGAAGAYAGTYPGP